MKFLEENKVNEESIQMGKGYKSTYFNERRQRDIVVPMMFVDESNSYGPEIKRRVIISVINNQDKKVVMDIEHFLDNFILKDERNYQFKVTKVMSDIVTISGRSEQEAYNKLNKLIQEGRAIFEEGDSDVVDILSLPSNNKPSKPNFE